MLTRANIDGGIIYLINCVSGAFRRRLPVLSTIYSFRSVTSL